MTAPQQSPEEVPRLDALRRALYRPDATDADRQRYAAEQQAVRPPDPEATTAAAPAAPVPRRWRLGLTVLAVVLAAAGGILVGQRFAQPLQQTARPTAAPVLQQDVQDGARYAVDTAGVSGPRSVATTVRGTAVIGQRFEGRGSAVVPVDLLPGTFDGGRAMVVLTAARSAPTEWRALRLLTRNDFSSFPVVMAHGTADPGTLVATPSTFVFPGAPPARIAVEAPDDVRWTLVVAASPQIADQLH
ncbi:hypothetical protein GCM10025783_11640 [Amnibacterium soli]|uniref:Uncharacterized protein n=1 Tax=Amnibacterium soli TaxID=1282736 RepID=A0ABP8YZ57_9MICO